MTGSRYARRPWPALLDEARRAPAHTRPAVRTDPEEHAAYRKERLAACTDPRLVEILPDLPRTASGKILRRELRSRSRESQ